MGTPEFAVPVLETLEKSVHEVLSVVTRPDKPKGRGLAVTAPPVKIAAAQRALPIIQPGTLDSEELKSSILSLEPDAVVVAAYGRLIPSWLLEYPRYGCLNIHPSLLPKYRGAAPIQRAIMAGDAETGVTIMVLDEGMDTGDIVLQESVPVSADETSGELAGKLAQKAGELILKALNGLESGSLRPQKQGQAGVSYAPKIEKEEALIDWSRSAVELGKLIRALNPAPGAYTFFRGRRLKLWRTELRAGTRNGHGAIIQLDQREGPVVVTGKGSLLLREVQLEGKARLGGADFLRGHQIKVGEKLGSR